MPPHGRRGLIWHAITLHPQLMRNIHRQKICANINMQTDIAISVVDMYKNNVEKYCSHASQLLTNEQC